MHTSSPLFLLLECAVLVSVGIFARVLYLSRRASREKKYPPSPPSDPIIGHLRMIPQTGQETTFLRMAKQYGDIIYLSVLQTPMLVLSSAKHAENLLEKRGAKYSSRPKFTMFELLGWRDPVTLAFSQYGPDFRRQRTELQQRLDPRSCLKYQSIQTDEARLLVKNLLARPKDIDLMVRRFAASIVMRIAYGHQIVSDDDKMIELIRDFNVALSQSGPPGNTAIDIFPVLQHIPPWIPLLGRVTRHLRTWEKASPRLMTFPYDELRDRMSKGLHQPCIMADVLDEISSNDLSGPTLERSLKDAKMLGGTFYAAGADTTWATVLSFFAAMLFHPEVQEKARKELFTVLGKQRLPELSDRPNLPYVERVLQETLRWRVAVPFIPHLSVEDDVYNGFDIPKGTLVFANALAINRDERVYQNPEDFNPDRFAPQPKGRNEPYSAAIWGFGRRICPGRYLAEASLWIAIATTLYTLEINPVNDGDSKYAKCQEDLRWESGLVCHPNNWMCTIQSNSEDTQSLIHD